MNHPFLDGNKQFGFFATDVFLRLNGFRIECDNKLNHGSFMRLFESNGFRRT